MTTTATAWRNRILGEGEESPDQLLANPRNFRIHPKNQQDALAGVLDSVGWVQRVIVNRNTQTIVDGHLRVSLALQRNEPMVPVLYVDLDEAEEALILATFDPLSALAATDTAKLDELLRDISTGDAAVQQMLAELAAASGLNYGKPEPVEDPGAQIDRAEELRKKWQTERGQLWSIGKHRLLCGDSTSAENVARLMGGAKADMVWTDPPYGVAIGDKNKWLNSIAPSNRIEENLTGDAIDENALFALVTGAFAQTAAICAAGAAWYVAAPAGPLQAIFGNVLRDLGIWRQTIAWVKNNATFSPMGVSYHWAYEPIIYGWMPNGAHRYYGDRKQTTVWEIDRPMKSPEHPTMKPVELVTRAIEHSSLSGESVYDAFLGSGTTMVAAEQTGRVCYGMEISEKYTAVCLERLSGMGLTPVLQTSESIGM